MDVAVEAQTDEATLRCVEQNWILPDEKLCRALGLDPAEVRALDAAGRQAVASSS